MHRPSQQMNKIWNKYKLEKNKIYESQEYK